MRLHILALALACVLALVVPFADAMDPHAKSNPLGPFRLKDCKGKKPPKRSENGVPFAHNAEHRWRKRGKECWN